MKSLVVGGTMRVLDGSDASPSGGGALRVEGGLYVGRQAVFAGGLTLDGGGRGPLDLKIKSKDGAATLTLQVSPPQ